MNKYMKGEFHIGKLIFSKFPKPAPTKGEEIRVGWMIGKVVNQIGNWTIWERTC